MSLFYDIHTHILPGIDDGCKTPEESLLVIKEEIEQGCSGMIATPHYYSRESIQDFLVKRERSFEALKRCMSKELPQWEEKIKLGAEVAYTPFIAADQDLEKIRLGDSDFILIEMPFMKWDRKVMRDIELIQRYHGLTPVIAHLERYKKYADKGMVEELMDQGAAIQINAGMFRNFFDRITAKKWIREGKVRVIATDTHNMSSRPPDIRLAREFLEKEKMEDDWKRIADFSAALMKGTPHP